MVKHDPADELKAAKLLVTECFERFFRMTALLDCASPDTCLLVGEAFAKLSQARVALNRDISQMDVAARLHA